MSDLNQDPNITAPPVPDATPAASTPAPLPDSVIQAIQEARKASEAAQQTAIANAEFVRSLRPPTPDPGPAFEEITDDLDPDVAAAVEKRVQRQLNTVLHSIDQVYKRDRQTDLTYRASLERERAAAQLGDAGWKELEPEVVKYMAQAPVHLQATPGAWQEAYYATLGRKIAEERVASARRGPPVNTGGRPSDTLDRPTNAISDADKEAYKTIFGEELNDKALSKLSGRVSITDYTGAN